MVYDIAIPTLVSWDDEIPNVSGKIRHVPVTTSQAQCPFEEIPHCLATSLAVHLDSEEGQFS